MHKFINSNKHEKRGKAIIFPLHIAPIICFILTIYFYKIASSETTNAAIIFLILGIISEISIYIFLVKNEARDNEEVKRENK